MDPSSPVAVLVNGPSSSGKSTLCRALQARLTALGVEGTDRAFLQVAFDDCVAMFSDILYPRVFVELQGGDLDRLVSQQSGDGRAAWEYVDQRDAPGRHGGHPRVRLVFNAYGRRVLRGLHRGWGAHLRLGNHLIIDHFLQDRDWHEELAAIMNEVSARTFHVGVFCSLEELERRESNRADGALEGRPLGLARRSDELCHDHGMVYDVRVHTDRESTSDSVERIVAAMRQASVLPGAP